jgi:hypothetical protein
MEDQKCYGRYGGSLWRQNSGGQSVGMSQPPPDRMLLSQCQEVDSTPDFHETGFDKLKKFVKPF